MPCTDIVRAFTAQSIAGAVIGAGGTVIDCVMRRSCEIASSRTWLVNEALRLGGTHLLFVDADMMFPDDTIPRLLAHEKDIVAADYHKRQFPLTFVGQPLTERAETLYQAKHAGTGLMLIDLSIFKKEWVNPQTGTKVAWFNFGRDSQGQLALGEDAWFCYSARDNGFETWIDPTLQVGHVGEYIY